MRYIVLLRGINVGGNKKVEMKRLRALAEGLGYTDVSTYINSGNLLFSSGKARDSLEKELGSAMRQEFGFEIGLLVKTEAQVKAITGAIPADWQNDDEARCDVAYLFPEADTKKVIDELPVKREYVDVRYAPGAIVWRVMRKDYDRSYLNKLVGHKLYKFMTVRNVNTARYLAGMSSL